MTDTTHDLAGADDGFHEIHLSGKQLVFLFMATTIVSVLIFLLGVMVGRGVPVQRQTADQPFADPTPVAAVASPPIADATPPPAQPPSTVAEGGELSYRQRLEAPAPPGETLDRDPAPAPRLAVPVAAPDPPVQAGPVTIAGSPAPGVWVVQVHALRDRSVAEGIVRRLIAKDYPAFLVAAGPPTGTYKVHVGRFTDRESAQRTVERLKKEEQFNPWITR